MLDMKPWVRRGCGDQMFWVIICEMILMERRRKWCKRLTFLPFKLSFSQCSMFDILKCYCWCFGDVGDDCVAPTYWRWSSVSWSHSAPPPTSLTFLQSSPSLWTPPFSSHPSLCWSTWSVSSCTRRHRWRDQWPCQWHLPRCSWAYGLARLHKFQRTPKASRRWVRHTRSNW